MIGATSKARYLIAFKVALTLAFIVAGVWYVISRKDEFAELRLPSALPILLVAVAFLANVYIRSLYNQLVARKFGTEITAAESFMLSAVVAAGNFVLPARIGAGLRAIYMKRIYDFPVSYFASGLVVFFVVNVTFISLAAVVLLYLLYLDTGVLRVDLSMLFPLLLGLALIAVLYRLSGGGSVVQAGNSWWGSFRQGFLTIVGARRLVLVSAAIVCANFLLSSIAWTVALRDYAPDVAVLEAFLLAASQIAVGFITLTPGAAGFQEVVGLYVAKTFPATTVQIFAVLVWVRLVRMAVACAVAVPSILVLRRRMKAGAILPDRADPSVGGV